MSAILWAFPREKIALGVLEVPDTPKNKSGQLITKLAPKLARIGKKKIPPIPTMANDSFLEGNERNMEEMGNVRKVGKISRREPG